MKAASAALIALLATGQFISADLYTFTLVDGTVKYYTSFDINITVNGHTYLAGGTTGPYFKRVGGTSSAVHWKFGVEVDTLQFDVIPGTGQIEGIDFLQACGLGLFDGAELQLERCFMPTVGDVTAGTIILFVGRVAEIDFGRSVAKFNISSHLELLNQSLPRNLFQSACLNTLYDAGCTLTKSSFAVTSTAQSGSTTSTINTTLSNATGYFDLGQVKFTSGNNSGFSRAVKAFISATNFTLTSPFPFTPVAGDAFTIYPGCDKTQSVCTNKFSNLINFRGQPYIPQPETTV